MISESKILTVSYGTFSCTLEGFDDSFSTMKAIAEYFKGLAAEDRYFGAEPPVPDAEMLTRIAEREVHSRVQAQIGENGIVLRAGEQEGEITPESAPVGAPAIETPQSPAPVAEASAPAEPAPVATNPAPKPDPFAGDTTSDAPESVAAKLQRIRAAVSRAPSDIPLEVIEDANSEDLFAPIESAFQDIEEEEVTAAPAQEPAPETAQDVATEVADASVEESETISEVFEDLSEVEDETNDEDVIEATTENSVDVSVADAAFLESEDEAEDEASLDDDASVLDGIGAFMAHSDSADATSASDEDGDDQADAPVDATDISSILGAVAADETDADISETTEDVAQHVDEEEAMSETETVDEAALADTSIEEEFEDSTTSETTEESDYVAEAEKPTKGATQDPVRTPKGGVSNVAARARARVVGVKKEDLEVAVENDTVEEVLETSEEPADNIFTENDVQIDPVIEHEADQKEEPILSAKDEAELMAELSGATNESTEIPELEPLPEVTAYHSLSKKTDEDNVNRLMEESDTKFADSEGTRRRSAIAHLKAAVAATVADRKILGGSSKPKSDDTGAYRQDLADVVQPSRADRRSGSEDDRPAPLVLVSEQRIDLHDGPAVRPSRVGKVSPELRDVNEDLGEGDSKTAKHLAESKSFAEFAERVGAIELPDLLEAAAAYASFVEGKEHFTRPDIMRRALQFAEDQGVSREEGLRSFGLLLRQGKIEKVKRGQFKIAETTRFKPETRIAGE